MKKLNKGNRIVSNDLFYEVVAVVMSTAYLREIKCVNDAGCYDIKDIFADYRIEIVNRN